MDIFYLGFFLGIWFMWVFVAAVMDIERAWLEIEDSA
jgi:hypothetical protein